MFGTHRSLSSLILQLFGSSLETVHNVVMINDTRQLRGQDNVGSYVLMIHKCKSIAIAVFRSLCHLRQIKVDINWGLSNSILADLKVLHLVMRNSWNIVILPAHSHSRQTDHI